MTYYIGIDLGEGKSNKGAVALLNDEQNRIIQERKGLLESNENYTLSPTESRKLACLRSSKRASRLGKRTLPVRTTIATLDSNRARSLRMGPPMHKCLLRQRRLE